MLQDGIKIAGRNINNLIYADDTSMMAESKEELQSLLMRVKEESEKAGLKLKNKQTNKKTKIMASGPIQCMANRRKKMKAVSYFLFLSSKITVDAAMKLEDSCFLARKL